MANDYKSQQSLVNENVTAWQQLEQAEKNKLAQNPQSTVPMTQQDTQKLANDLGVTQGATHDTSGRFGDNSRPVAEGTSGADQFFMDDQDYAILQQLQKQYASATTQAEKDAAHLAAEQLRAKHQYSGGADGSMHIPIGDLQQQAGIHNEYLYGPKSPADTYMERVYGSNPGTGAGTGGGASDLRNLLDQWKAAATEQQNAKIDHAVQQAVTELERALEDAQPMFKEQAESVAKEERQALDNSALYAEARGDKGGIGKEQYNEIQAAAAQNHLAVQQAQTKLSTDTARQIADLRAQGEFEKADAALQIAQNYLSQLISLEQWAAEFGLSQAQFQERVRQWEAEFNLAMQQFQVDTDLAYGSATGRLPSTGQLTLSAQKDLASMGEALLSAGIPPTDEQLQAMGITREQASAYMTQMQLEAAGNGTGGDAPVAAIPALGTDAWLQYISEAASLTGQSVTDYLRDNKSALGLSDSYISEYARSVERWQNDQAELLAQQAKVGTYDANSVADLGITDTSEANIDSMINEGILRFYTDPKTGQIVVLWASGWDPFKYAASRRSGGVTSETANPVVPDYDYSTVVGDAKGNRQAKE